MMVPPFLSPIVSPHNTWQQGPQHNPDSSRTSLLEGRVGRPNLPLTACHPPSLHLSTVSPHFWLYFQKGVRRGQGKEGRRTSVFVHSLGNVALCAVPSVWLDNRPTGRESPTAVFNIVGIQIGYFKAVIGCIINVSSGCIITFWCICTILVSFLYSPLIYSPISPNQLQLNILY